MSKPARKIFQIGFNKCGTKTIAQFFRRNGVKSVHWDYGKLARRIVFNIENYMPILNGYEDYQCFCDMEYLTTTQHIEAYRLFELLHHDHPDAVFILNTRQIDDWVNSRMAWREGYWARRYANAHDLPLEKLPSAWRKARLEHHGRVRKFFADKPGSLVEIDIGKGPAKLIAAMPDFELDADKWGHVGQRKIKTTSLAYMDEVDRRLR